MDSGSVRLLQTLYRNNCLTRGIARGLFRRTWSGSGLPRSRSTTTTTASIFIARQKFRPSCTDRRCNNKVCFSYGVRSLGTMLNPLQEIKLPYLCDFHSEQISSCVNDVTQTNSTSTHAGNDSDLIDRNGMVKAHENAVRASAACLLKGGVLAVPTDTIYGVAGLAQNTDAVNRLYEIKKRQFQNPVAISVATVDDIYRWSKVTVPREVLHHLLPGPVTVVFERSPDLNPTLNPHTSLVGMRIPKHRFMQDLARECGSPIALTSANISGASSCLEIEEFQTLWPHLDIVVNGGKLSDTEESRLGSTVVDLSVPGKFRIIRPGSAYQTTRQCLCDVHRMEEVYANQEQR